VSPSALELILRHDRWILTAGLWLVVALAWGWLFAGAGMPMSGVEMTRMSLGANAFMDMPMMVPAQWSVGYALLMLAMWWIMMVAMMLPNAAPLILLAAALNRKADPEHPPFGTSGAFVCGYLLCWGGFSVIAVAAQWGLAELGVLSDMLIVNSDALAGGIMIIAGIWQFTPLKRACLRHCRSPVHFLTQTRRPNSGPLIMGMHHGLFCLGCCWFLMLLLFVGGVMNLLWVAGLALYVWLEKGLQFGHRVSQFAGAGLILWGASLLI
jgi:predicted metal-binding membrane protein